MAGYCHRVLQSQAARVGSNPSEVYAATTEGCRFSRTSLFPHCSPLLFVKDMYLLQQEVSDSTEI